MRVSPVPLGPVPTVTLRDIAKVCGVSHGLVCRALRGRVGVAPANREVILRTAKKLGYRPNPLVSILLSDVRKGVLSGRKANLAWVNTTDSKNWWKVSQWDCGYLRGARERAEQMGFGLDEFWLHAKGMRPAALARTLKARNIFGVIFPNAALPASMDGFDWSRHASVLINWAWPQSGFSRASADAYGNLGLALNALTDRGFTRIGLHCQPEFDAQINNNQLNSRYLHYSHALPKAWRIPVLNAESNFPQAIEEMTAWLDRWKPEVIICQDNRLIDAIKTTGRRVPEDLSVVHLNLAADVTGWAGVDAGIEHISAAAVDLVVGQLGRNEFGNPSFSKVVTIAGEWRDGFTLATPRSRTKPAHLQRQ